MKNNNIHRWCVGVRDNGVFKKVAGQHSRKCEIWEALQARGYHKHLRHKIWITKLLNRINLQAEVSDLVLINYKVQTTFNDG